MATPSPSEQDFHLRFWGVRGTIPCPGGQFARYGGNTSCIEVRCGDYLFVLDAGTGLRPLGEQLTRDDAAHDLDIYLTHTHLDHILGLPFFTPMFSAENKIRIHCGHLASSDVTLREVMVRMTAAPLFPVPLEAFAADLDFAEFTAGDTLTPRPGVAIRTAPLNHPNGATGYRVEFDGRSICYVTDTEHVEGELDRNILELIEGAEIFIYDGTYTDAEYPRFRGWGHSTWQAGALLAEAANIGQYIIFHHAPEHTDDDMDEIADAARMVFPNTMVAREGLILRP